MAALYLYDYRRVEAGRVGYVGVCGSMDLWKLEVEPQRGCYYFPCFPTSGILRMWEVEVFYHWHAHVCYGDERVYQDLPDEFFLYLRRKQVVSCQSRVLVLACPSVVDQCSTVSIEFANLLYSQHLKSNLEAN